jgi:hypothetical protein
VSPPVNGNISELYGVCSNGVLTDAASMGGFAQGYAPETLTIATAATPLPAALPLFATGLGALALLGCRRRRTGPMKLNGCGAQCCSVAKADTLVTPGETVSTYYNCPPYLQRYMWPCRFLS